MDCLEFAALLQYIHQEGNPAETQEVQRHIAHCNQCRQDVAAIQSMERRLGRLSWPVDNQALSATSCMGAMTLAAYIDNRLIGPELEQVEQHLSHCQTCLEELIAVGQQLEALEASPLQVPPDFSARGHDVRNYPNAGAVLPVVALSATAPALGCMALATPSVGLGWGGSGHVASRLCGCLATTCANWASRRALQTGAQQG